MLFIILFSCIAIWLLTELIFWISHRRPLTETEIKKLMKKRRDKYIKVHFTLRETNSYPDKDFKSKLRPSGRLYASDIDCESFPSYVSNLLKGKKHEWVVLACLKDNKVKCFYANKGNDNQSVSFNVDIYELVNFCVTNGYQTVMRFHNHPNSDPQHYTHFLANEQDRRSAEYLSNITLSAGINWLDYVFERGHVLVFARKFSEEYYPAECSFKYISEENSMKKDYYKLQRELGIFR